MDIIKQNKNLIIKILNTISFIFLMISGLCLVILSIDGIMNSSGSEYYDPIDRIYSIFLCMDIFDLILGISLIVSPIIFGVILRTKKDNKIEIMFKLIPLIISAFSLLEVIFSFEIVVISDGMYTAADFLIFKTIFSILIFVLSILVFFLRIKKINKFIPFVTYTLLFVYVIVNMAHINAITYLVHLAFLMLFILFAIAIRIFDILLTTKSSNDIKNIAEPNLILKKEEIKSSGNPYEDLIKLKELCDKGIITKEEFDLKKEKYIDIL